MTSMNREEALVYLMKTSRNSTANRNIAYASGVHKHFAVPIGPTSGEGQQGEPPEAALPCHCRGAVRSSRCSILPPPATQLSHFPRVKRGKQKARVRKRGLASPAARSAARCWPHHGKSTGGVTARTAPRQRCRASPPGRDVCFPYLPAAVAYKTSA